LVPVSFSPSRITHNNGVSGGASVEVAFPFTIKFVDIASSVEPAASIEVLRYNGLLHLTLFNGVFLSAWKIR
jgi:hypothetical protein